MNVNEIALNEKKKEKNKKKFCRSCSSSAEEDGDILVSSTNEVVADV